MFVEALEARRFLSHTKIAPPAAPTNLSATPDGSSPVIRLTWTDNSSKQTGVVVERKKGRSGVWAVVASLPAASTYYRDAHLAEGTVFSYRMAAINRAGDSAFTAVTSALTWQVNEPVLNADFGSGGNSVIGASQDINQIAVSPEGTTIYATTDGSGSGTSAPMILAMPASGNAQAAFGSGGKIIVDDVLPTPIKSIERLVVQSDGKLLVAGNTAGNTDNSSNSIVVARFNSDGSLDTTFAGGRGEFVAGFDGQEELTALALAPDGSIYVGGLEGNGVEDLIGRQLFAVHITAGGLIDQSYGTNGIVEGGQQPAVGYGYIETQYQSASMAFDPTDGSVVFAGDVGDVDNNGIIGGGGLVGVRLFANSTVSTIFSNYEISGGSVMVDADGKLVVAGSNGNGTVLRFNADGTADPSWVGPASLLPVNRGDNEFVNFNSITQLSDGSYIVAGDCHDRTDEAFIAHLSATDGSLIGTYVFDLPAKETGSGYEGVASSSDGSIFAGGYTTNALLLSKYYLPG
jgi:uncharacterized delta-60 repeat protein